MKRNIPTNLAVCAGIAYLLFASSFFLPVLDSGRDFRGWNAVSAAFVFLVFPLIDPHAVGFEPRGAIYFSALFVGSICMSLSPIFLFRGRGFLWWYRWLFLLGALSALLPLITPAPGSEQYWPQPRELLIGYYTWVASMFVMVAAIFIWSRPLREKGNK